MPERREGECLKPHDITSFTIRQYAYDTRGEIQEIW